MSNTNSNTKSLLITIIVLLILATAGVGVLGYFSYGFRNWDFIRSDGGEDKTIQTPINNVFVSDINNSPAVALYAGETYAVSASESNSKYLEKTLTATVLPTDATNKEVDWTLEKVYSEDTNKIELISEADGSCVVKLRIYASVNPFSVTVTTREGGHSASCNVTYSKTPRVAEFGKSIGLIYQQSKNASPIMNNYDIEDGKVVIPLHTSVDTNGADIITTDSQWNGTYPVASFSASLTFKEFFGSEVSFKNEAVKASVDCSVKFSDGTKISSSNFRCLIRHTWASDKHTLYFAFNDAFASAYRNKLKSDTNTHVVIEIYNKHYDCVIGTLEVYFTIPTSGVKVSETEVSI